MDPCVAKSDLEWFAKREIERLRSNAELHEDAYKAADKGWKGAQAVLARPVDLGRAAWHDGFNAEN